MRYDGGAAYVVDRAHIIRDGAGSAVRMVGRFFDVTQEKEIASRKLQSQKLEAMGELTGGVAHDFNNLLTIIIGNTELLSDMVKNPKLRHMAEVTIAAAERGAALTSRLLAFARKQPLSPRKLNVNHLLLSMNEMLKRTLSENVHINFLPKTGLWTVELDGNQLEMAILNLAINARDAMALGGNLTIATRNAALTQGDVLTNPEVLPGDYVLVSVTDTGTGMSPEIIGRAFEPFFTTKAEGFGSGLGLSMVYGFVKQSGGHIKIESAPGKGTTMKLYFPRSTSRGRPISRRAKTAPVIGGSEHILVVEDDSFVREHLVTQLQRLGYRVTQAKDGVEAFQALSLIPDVDLLFTDLIMPGGMTGTQISEAALQLYPAIKILFTSGYSADAIVHNGRLDAGVFLLSKPYRKQQLAETVRFVLDSAPAIEAVA
jgi:signal transduction histidine kinase